MAVYVSDVKVLSTWRDVYWKVRILEAKSQSSRKRSLKLKCARLRDSEVLWNPNLGENSFQMMVWRMQIRFYDYCSRQLVVLSVGGLFWREVGL
jgi:hypothetical protein